jgi:hypothetical protein
MLVIRRAQLEQIGRAMRAPFVELLAAHLQEYFPDRCARLGPAAALRDWIEDGIARAGGYGIDVERDVCRFLDMRMELGDDFDRDPALPWAHKVLTDPQFAGSSGARADALDREASFHLLHV